MAVSDKDHADAVESLRVTTEQLGALRTRQAAIARTSVRLMQSEISTLLASYRKQPQSGFNDGAIQALSILKDRIVEIRKNRRLGDQEIF